MDIRQLRYFKEIVDQGSISKAAVALHMAQPPLSMLLKQLEEHYGMLLIKRYREKWTVTEAGKVLYNHAVQMLNDIELLDVKMNYLKQGTAGRVRVGVSSSCVHLIEQAIKDFSVHYPKANLHLVKADSAKIERMLYANEIDMAIILMPDNIHMYEMVMLPSSPFALAMPQKWYEQMEGESFSLQQFSGYPFILLEAMEGYSMLEEIKHYLEAEKVELNVIVECKDIPLVRQLVTQEVGISILPTIAETQRMKIRYIALPKLNTKIQPVLLYKKETELSPICTKFIELFK